jgi:hypothetical protein
MNATPRHEQINRIPPDAMTRSNAGIRFSIRGWSKDRRQGTVIIAMGTSHSNSPALNRVLRWRNTYCVVKMMGHARTLPKTTIWKNISVAAYWSPLSGTGDTTTPF